MGTRQKNHEIFKLTQPKILHELTEHQNEDKHYQLKHRNNRKVRYKIKVILKNVIV